jgi:predicted nucleic acid-binding protein
LSTFFVDTSALGRRYLSEVGTAWTVGWIESAAGNVIMISELTTVEMMAVFAHLQRMGTLSAPNATRLQNDFLFHATHEYLIVPVDSSVFGRASSLVRKHTLRTLDALHLAAALKAVALLQEPMTFVSGDKRQLTAAAAEGFVTDDPYLHP